jgi:tRNA-2-methylthio-N6-dimethylallyladenosine synthase
MCDRIVVFEGMRRLIGQIIPVAIYETTPFTLFGRAVTRQVGPEVYTLEATPR